MCHLIESTVVGKKNLKSWMESYFFTLIFIKGAFMSYKHVDVSGTQAHWSRVNLKKNARKIYFYQPCVL